MHICTHHGKILILIKKSCWYSSPITKKHGTTSIPRLNQQTFWKFIRTKRFNFQELTHNVLLSCQWTFCVLCLLCCRVCRWHFVFVFVVELLVVILCFVFVVKCVELTSWNMGTLYSRHAACVLHSSYGCERNNWTLQYKNNFNW